MKGYSQNLYFRQSCYYCPVKSFKSDSDITLGDYWGIKYISHDFYDNNGISLVMITSQKGKDIYDTLKKIDIETDYKDAIIDNPCIEKSSMVTIRRDIFFKRMHEENIIKLINELTYITLLHRVVFFIRNCLRNILRKMGLLSVVKSILRKS
jgi:hypothetical protein